MGRSRRKGNSRNISTSRNANRCGSLKDAIAIWNKRRQEIDDGIKECYEHEARLQEILQKKRDDANEYLKSLIEGKFH